ncbi:hypothetical protein NDU88_007200 [Pleurodeles waltl]|uniref:Uncharacterized protein n=1 Tax=Pleurodeles waltl TaxID=8319 RepID=A0AAV7MFS5_PLEWA|nr:hypothetical protein NDU88_007200 [Pleurodeles waltl]
MDVFNEEEVTIARQVTVVIVTADVAAMYILVEDLIDGGIIANGLSIEAEVGFLNIVNAFGGDVEGSEEDFGTSFDVEGRWLDFEEDLFS